MTHVARRLTYIAGRISAIAMLLFTGACSSASSRATLTRCPNISPSEIREFFPYGDSVLIAETEPMGRPEKKGVGDFGRGFTGTITTVFSIRPMKFYKNEGRLPTDQFTAADVAVYGNDGGFQGGGFMPDFRTVSLIAVKKSKDDPLGREIFAVRRCVTPEDEDR